MTVSLTPAASCHPQPTFLNTDPSLRQFWHPVAREADLAEGGPRQVWLLGEPWVLVRLGGQLTALRDQCPHRLVPLSEGTVRADRLQCKYHGYEFDASGACRHIPALGPDGPVPARARVATASVRSRFGLIWISIDDPNCPPVDSDLDDAPYRDPELDTFLAGPFVTPVGAAVLTDNFLDVTHLPFLHAATFGAYDSGQLELTSQRDGWTVTQQTQSVLTTAEDENPVDVRYDYTVRGPFNAELKMTYLSGPSDGRTDYVWSFCQPEAADRSTWYLVHAYTGLQHDQRRIDAATDFQRAVGLEDLSILEAMPVPQLPLGRGAEFHTRGDSGCVSYRRMLQEISAFTPPVGGLAEAMAATS